MARIIVLSYETGNGNAFTVIMIPVVVPARCSIQDRCIPGGAGHRCAAGKTHQGQIGDLIASCSAYVPGPT